MRRPLLMLSGCVLLAAVACKDVTEPPASRPPGLQASLVWNITTTDLGSPAAAEDINNLGQVAGYTTGGGQPFRAFVWDPGTDRTYIAALPGSFATIAHGINDLGQVVGQVSVPGQLYSSWHAFLWDQSGGMSDLGTLGYDFAEAYKINNLGQVVGRSNPGGGVQGDWTFLWSARTGMTGLGFPSSCYAGGCGINDLGQVVSYKFLWDPITGLTDLGVLGVGDGSANDINNLGQVVGTTNANHAFLWDPLTGLTDLGTFGGSWAFAKGVNDLGQVTGCSSLAGGAYHAFLWEPTTGMIDLGTPGGAESCGNSINNRGQIAGTVDAGTGHDRAVVWTVAGSRPATPAEEVLILTNDVNTLVTSGVLNQAQANGLLSKLSAVSRQLERENKVAATQLLQALINQVRAYVNAGILSSANGQTLIDAAQNAITQLGG